MNTGPLCHDVPMSASGAPPGGDPLRPLDHPRLYELVVDRLRQHVVSEALGAGARLPAERELAERLGVSRTSIRQAILALEVQGLVEVRHGGGTYLRQDALEFESLDSLLARQRRLPEVLEARDALEPKFAELAALRRTDEDLQALDLALREMKASIARGEHGVDEDRRFHMTIVAAARSTILAEFMSQIGTDIAETRRESLAQPGRPPRSLIDHHRILDAIRTGDGRRAREAMHRHLRTVGNVKLLAWQPFDGV